MKTTRVKQIGWMWVLGWCLCAVSAQAQKLEFTLHKHRGEHPGPTVLVIGGIQGDEPGGFNAASLLVTDYQVTHGQIWVVPNLNFESIIMSSRGVYGDMNRKFSRLQEADPEYAQVQKIKSIILDPQVDVILNLHDGSGYYYPKYVHRMKNPNRWGQSVIIDQAEINADRYGNLLNIAQRVIARANPAFKSDYQYHIKNTNTALGDVEMEKTLTYFAIQRGKSAFGIEASKDFLTHERVFFHLNIVESFLREIGVGFERHFDLNPIAIRDQIDGNVRLAMYDSRLFFDMANARKQLRYIPIKKNSPLQVTPSNPLIAVLDNRQQLNVRYGNRSITELLPFYTEFDDSLNHINVRVDGEIKQVALGTELDVNRTFRILPQQEYRVNVIGYYKQGTRDESDIDINRRELMSQYSVDKAGQLYRVEIYKADRFCGMVLVRFINQPVATFDTGRHTTAGDDT